MPEPQINVSKRFQKAYQSSSPGLAKVIESLVCDLVRAHRNMSKAGFLRHYREHAVLGSTVREAHVSSKDRMLFTFRANQYVLLDVGGHDTVPLYTRQKLNMDLADPVDAPACFWPEHRSSTSFFVHRPRTTTATYFTECAPDWLYFLSRQQAEVSATIVETIVEHYGKRLRTNFIVLGGPGTGKTSVLLNTMKGLLSYGASTKLVVSEPVLTYIRACNPPSNLLNMAITRDQFYSASQLAFQADVLLMDDPTPDEMTRAFELRDTGAIESVVLAFDPLQSEPAITDADMKRMIKKHKTRVFTLTECYRQKALIGTYAFSVMKAVAASTPFLNTDKIQEFRDSFAELTLISNDVTFPNPGGHLAVNDNSGPLRGAAALQSEIDTLLRMRLWTHTTPLLVVFDPELSGVSPKAEAILAPIRHDIVSLDDVRSIKGLEYQHVIILIGLNLFNQLQHGFRGSGQRIYQQRRLLRIPFSRAKDSIVTFVLTPND